MRRLRSPRRARAPRINSGASGQIGVAFAAASAVSYGLTVVFGRSLARARLGASTVLGVRFAIATVLLAALAAASRTPMPRRLLGVAFVMGALGYASQATLFFAALERGTAAAVTLLFYAYPAIVVLYEIPARRRRPPPATLVALAASSGGVAVIVAASGDIDISRTGALLALGAGAAFGAYVLAGGRLLAALDPRASALGVCAGTAAAFLAYGALRGELELAAAYLPQLAGNGLATAAAFACLFAALARTGPSEVSVVMTLEAFAATALAAIALREAPTMVEVLGGGAIVTGAAVIAARARTGVSGA